MTVDEFRERMNALHAKKKETAKQEYTLQSNEPSELTLKQIKWYNDTVGDLNEYDGYNCSKCKNRGDFAKVSDTGNIITVSCDCRRTRSILAMAKNSGLNTVLKDYTFKNFDVAAEWQKTILDKAQAFCNDAAAQWFYIGGQVGCGKTHLCTAIAAHYIKTGYNVKYMLWADESKLLKATVNDKDYSTKISPYKLVDVLYIDDFLKVKQGEEPTSADLSLAFEIINHRLIAGNNITIISSEKMLDEIMAYDEATMSRIYQKAGDYIINIPKDKAKNYCLKNNVLN